MTEWTFSIKVPPPEPFEYVLLEHGEPRCDGSLIPSDNLEGNGRPYFGIPPRICPICRECIMIGRRYANRVEPANNLGG